MIGLHIKRYVMLAIIIDWMKAQENVVELKRHFAVRRRVSVIAFNISRKKPIALGHHGPLGMRLE